MLTYQQFPIQLTKDTYIDYITVCCEYSQISKNTIYEFKYKSVKMIGKLIAQLMYYCCSIPNCDYITYVPLHTTKQNRRGFNQSEEIAQHLSTLLNKPIIHLLTKNKAGISQMSIKDKNIRINNLEGTINYLGNINIDNKKILIVDDIYTTGSTLNYCAKIIKMNTINTSVSAICFAHRS